MQGLFENHRMKAGAYDESESQQKPIPKATEVFVHFLIY